MAGIAGPHRLSRPFVPNDPDLGKRLLTTADGYPLIWLLGGLSCANRARTQQRPTTFAAAESVLGCVPVANRHSSSSDIARLVVGLACPVELTLLVVNHRVMDQIVSRE